MIDLDMEEIVSAVGSNDITEAIRIYTSGGNGLCSAADVADTTIVQCTATTDVKGNSVKGSGAVRTIKGFATSGEAKMTKWTTYPVYKAYYNDFNYADTFITNAATHTNANGDDDQFRQQMIKKSPPTWRSGCTCSTSSRTPSRTAPPATSPPTTTRCTRGTRAGRSTPVRPWARTVPIRAISSTGSRTRAARTSARAPAGRPAWPTPTPRRSPPPLPAATTSRLPSAPAALPS